MSPKQCEMRDVLSLGGCKPRVVATAYLTRCVAWLCVSALVGVWRGSVSPYESEAGFVENGKDAANGR